MRAARDFLARTIRVVKKWRNRSGRDPRINQVKEQADSGLQGYRRLAVPLWRGARRVAGLGPIAEYP